ncbi:MAG: ring-cleaving dioxygenase [Nibricoccus sp.]
MQLAGFHHVTSVTADIAANHAFYVRTLGLRLVKKSVNQDDVSAYHLFYGDGEGTPGTELTFFDWRLPREQRGTSSVVRVGLRLATEADLCWWEERLHAAGVVVQPIQTVDGRLTLPFEDPEGHRLALITDAQGEIGRAWLGSDVPVAHRILGLGPITVSVPALAPTRRMLEQILGMSVVREYELAGTTVTVFAMSAPGAAGELHVAAEPNANVGRLGAGGVHHLAFRTNATDFKNWEIRLKEARVANSGVVDRFYFRSLYFREPNGVLFEIATNGPGFAVDEAPESLGQKLALPPFLEPRRAEIEAGLIPL